MECMRSRQLIAYMDNELSELQSRQLEQHLESCMYCQERLRQLMDQIDDFDDTAGDASPDEAFKQRILDKVVPYAEASQPPPAEKRQITRKQMDWKGRSIDIMKKMSIAVAGLTIAVTLGTFVSPTFADYVKSLFNTEKADPGIKQAVEKGLAQPLDLKATDQGITLTVKEILADTMRIAVVCEAKDQDGKPIDLDEDSDITFVIKDKKGTPLIDPKEGGWKYGKVGDYIMIERELTEVIIGEKELPDELVVQIDIAEITGKKGKWVVNVPVDMAKAKTATKTVAINKQYTTPQGLVIDLQRADFSPSATLLTLETKLTPEMQAQKKEIIKKNGLKEDIKKGEPFMPYVLGQNIQNYQIAYELVDEEGKVVAAWDETLDEERSIEKNRIINGIHGRGKGSVTKWYHSFVPMTDKKKLTFKLHSVFSNDLSGISIKINPEDLKKQAIVTETNDNHIALKNLKLTEETFGKNKVKVGYIDIEATLAKDVVEAQYWRAKDETGKEYEVSLDRKSTTIKDGKMSFTGQLMIDNLENQPKELTLSIGTLTKQHRDVNWEVPIEISGQK